MAAASHPIVHLELQTANLPRACAFYTQLFDWRAETIRMSSTSYMALEFGRGLEGGVVERETEDARWLPYVEVDDLRATATRALSLGGRLVLGPREGPAGWRAIIEAPEGGEIALWQPKER